MLLNCKKGGTHVEYSITHIFQKCLCNENEKGFSGCSLYWVTCMYHFSPFFGEKNLCHHSLAPFHSSSICLATTSWWWVMMMHYHRRDVLMKIIIIRLMDLPSEKNCSIFPLNAIKMSCRINIVIEILNKVLIILLKAFTIT